MEEKDKKFQVLITNYQDMIYRLCCSYVSDVEGRKDLYQNILIRLWKGIDIYKGRSSLSTWVYRISVNTSLDFLRRDQKIRHTSKQVDVQNIELSDKSNNVEEDLIFSETTEHIYKCINNLTFIDKTIISLYLEELSYRNIADIVGISEKNVSVKLHRIKKKINECLKDV